MTPKTAQNTYFEVSSFSLNDLFSNKSAFLVAAAECRRGSQRFEIVKTLIITFPGSPTAREREGGRERERESEKEGDIYIYISK